MLSILEHLMHFETHLLSNTFANIYECKHLQIHNAPVRFLLCLVVVLLTSLEVLDLNLKDSGLRPLPRHIYLHSM